MKGGKKRPSVDPPPPPPAGDGGEKCAEGDHQSSVPPNPHLIDGTAEEDRSQHQQQQRKKKATTVEKEKGAEEEAPAAEEEEEGDEEEDEEEEGEKGNEHSEELPMEEGEDGEGDDERPKLAEGFYEIEAVRRKRIRKGEAQYLIKWRGWPETANTWEPLENLLSCSDVIDAFEESSRSGKRSSRKRRRKYGTTQSQTKKKQQQQRSPAAATYSVPAVKVNIVEDSLPFPPLEDPTVTNGEANVTGAYNTETANTVNDNGVKPVAYNAEETEEQNELYLKISQLKGATATNGYCEDKISLLSKESQLSEEGSLANGLQKADGSETVQSSRCTGAKKRKSGSVKRFKLEMPSGTTDGLQSVAALNGSCGVVANQGIQHADSGANVLQLKNKIENSKTICDITEIIKPVSYSTIMIDNIKDVSVTFTAKRADGKEVTVDNKFLKANHPVLLINFYEQHLRYTPA